VTAWTRGQFDRLADRYASSLDWVMARGRMTMVVFAGTLVATGLLFMVIPKNLFPEQDTGQIAVTTSAGQDVSYARMAALQQQVAQACSPIPPWAASVPRSASMARTPRSQGGCW
jgi:multidrug efflux pump